MRIGVAFPMTEIGHDLGQIREYVQAAEDLGYDHIRILDHVLGADPASHPDVDHFSYTHQNVIHEAFTLMAYMAGITKNIELVTGILILPQRQTALVAKQAAEVDMLSGGRLRLGIGLAGTRWSTRPWAENFPRQRETLRRADRGVEGPLDPGCGQLHGQMAPYN